MGRALVALPGGARGRGHARVAPPPGSALSGIGSSLGGIAAVGAALVWILGGVALAVVAAAVLRRRRGGSTTAD